MRLKKNAISAAQAAIVVIVLVIAAGASIYLYATSSSPPPTTSTSSTGTLSTAMTTTTGGSSSGKPTVLTYETPSTPQYMDPGVSYFSYDYTVFQQVYEQLLWYNGTNSGSVVPWLAQSYNTADNGKTYQFTLRSGINFADGNPMNATSVYFSLNRLLLFDASTPTAHGSQASWIVQQLLNHTLSTSLSGAPQTYGNSYVKAVLAENFIKITGPDTFRVNVMHPNAAFPFLMAGEWASIISPQFVMQHDMQLWTASGSGYTLPYPTLSGNLTNQINQYFYDLSATCNAGSTPAGCGTTYLDGSYTGSLAGTGPYVMTSYDKNTNGFVLTANSKFWGGPKGNIHPSIQTIDIKYVGDINTRELDLENAAKSGQAMVIDPDATHLYDLANRTAWLDQNNLKSTIPGVTLYGAYSGLATLFDPFDTNVTNAQTGSYYQFQPFADRRIRLAFADAVNITEIMSTLNNKLGQTAINVVAPGLPPTGAYFANDKPAYSYNLDQVQALMLDAMEHPLTSFTYANGTAAKAGVFNNGFGCTTLSSGQCTNPTVQNIQIAFGIGDTVDEGILDTIAGNINNVSATYNMGLTVSVVPLPTGTLLNEAFASPTHLYFYALGWFADYPWVVDFLGPMYAPANTYTGPDGWNLTAMANLYSQVLSASESNSIPALLTATHGMNVVANNEVMYLWTQYPLNFMSMTSNLGGFYYNPALSTSAAGGTGPEYFATLYIK
ncbi:MAG: hypothetical protein KGI38_02880 [Thaumarchaeota archaeon]|nr:hypothetical protein [Nitrososphaerota archaeon]